MQLLLTHFSQRLMSLPLEDFLAPNAKLPTIDRSQAQPKFHTSDEILVQSIADSASVPTHPKDSFSQEFHYPEEKILLAFDLMTIDLTKVAVCYCHKVVDLQEIESNLPILKKFSLDDKSAPANWRTPQ